MEIYHPAPSHLINVQVQIQALANRNFSIFLSSSNNMRELGKEQKTLWGQVWTQKKEGERGKIREEYQVGKCTLLC